MEESPSSFKMVNSKMWKTPKDFLEPQFYPDPGLFRNTLQQLMKEDHLLTKSLASSKAAFHVLAPYLKIMRKGMTETATKRKEGKKKPENVLLEKQSKEQMLLHVVPSYIEKEDLIFCINNTADIIETLLNAKYVVSYFVDPIKEEIFQSPSHIDSSIAKFSCKIEPGITIAAYVAYTKHYAVSDNICNDPRFPKGLGFPGSMLMHVLCVPIKTTDEKVVAVYEIVRDIYQNSFSVEEIQLVLILGGWMGVSIMQNSLFTSVVKQQELHKTLLQLTNQYHSGKATTDKTLTDLVTLARDTIGAENSYLFVVDKESKENIVLEQYDQGADLSRNLYRRRTKKIISKNGSALSKVMFNQEVVEEKESATDLRSQLDEHVERNKLYAPIVSLKETVGAIKLGNKKDYMYFTQEDKEILKTFAKFGAINLQFFKILENLKNLDLQVKVSIEMLFHHIKPCSHCQEAIKGYSDKLPDEFFTLTWNPTTGDTSKLVEHSINMFHKVLGDSFMAKNNVPNFVLTVSNCYRLNPYHNFVHAFRVLHAMANIIIRDSIFTAIERKSLMIAALCHDVDHRGYNNYFVQLTRHHFASLYDFSPLENHHFAVTKIILSQCKMFQYMKTEIYNETLDEIYNAILGTDLSLYFQNRTELLKKVDEKTFTFKDPAHKRLVKSLIMTACDLSDQTKPLLISQRITEAMYEEFYQQGDVEKKMGYVPLPMMDRNKKSMMAENQVQFLSVVVLPCIETVCSIFSSLSPMVWDCRVLLKHWKEIVEIKGKKTWKPHESIVT